MLDLLLISAVSGGVLLVLFAVISAISKASALTVGFICLLIFFAVQAAVIFLAFRISKAEKVSAVGASLNTLMSEVVRSFEFPAVITTSDGKIVWSNNAMLALCEAEKQTDVAGRNFSELSDASISSIITCPFAEGLRITVSERVFLAKGYLMETPDRDYWMTVLEDRTRL